MLMLAGLVAAWSPLPYSSVAVVPLVWAGVESVLAIRTRSAAQGPTRGIISSVVNLVLVCLLTVIVLAPYTFYSMAKSLQDCTHGANTAIAAADCNARYDSGPNSVLGSFLNFG